MGGLVSAALLAARGHDVTVLEKEAWVGGKARRVSVDGAAIDGGPTVFTYRAVFDEVFAALGARLEKVADQAAADALSPARKDDRLVLVELAALEDHGRCHAGKVGRLQLAPDTVAYALRRQ